MHKMFCCSVRRYTDRCAKTKMPPLSFLWRSERSYSRYVVGGEPSVLAVFPTTVSFLFVHSLCRRSSTKIVSSTIPLVDAVTDNSKRAFKRKKDRVIANYSGSYTITKKILDTLDRHPLKLDRSLQTPGGIYILFEEIIDYIIKSIGSDLFKEDFLIVEAGAGPGILTQSLLDAGVRRMCITEDKVTFLPHLEKLAESHYDRLTFIPVDFSNLPKLAFIDKVSAASNIENIFCGARVRSWDEDPPILVLGVLATSKEPIFLRYLPMALAERKSLFVFGRCQFLLFVSGNEYLTMIGTSNGNLRNYRSHSVLCQLFFDVELLRKEERNNFFPPSKNVKRKKLDFKVDNDHLYLVRLTPKREIGVPFSEHRELVFFVRQLMTSRRSYVIPALEKWIPKSGPRLIRNGFTIFTRFGDLSPTELVQLFIEFRSWPEYHDSNFREAMLRSLSETETTALIN